MSDLRPDWAVIEHCAYYGLLTCLTTGLGALPFFVCKVQNEAWLGAGNAMAAGMMIAASVDMAIEGASLEASDGSSHALSVLAAMLVGAVFVIASKLFFESYQQDMEVLNQHGIFSTKALLVIAVMAVHSIAEGVAIGVSFATGAPSHLGILIAVSLAIHNIPEGFAVAMSLVPHGCSPTRAALWGIFTSSPQPVMAVLACVFVNHFAILLPLGLGFAAGAMLYVAIVELLLEEAMVQCSSTTAVTTTAVAALFMHLTYLHLGAEDH